MASESKCRKCAADLEDLEGDDDICEKCADAEETANGGVPLSDEEKKAKIFGNLVMDMRCPGCGKPALRFFAPKKSFDRVVQQIGQEAAIAKYQAGLLPGRKLLELLTMTIAVRNKHCEPAGFNISKLMNNDSCDYAFTITTNPGRVAWDLFSSLRIIRAASQINGVEYQKVKDWWDTLPEQTSLSLMMGIVQFHPITDPKNRLEGGPYFVVWYNTDKIYTDSPTFYSRHVKSDPAWDKIRAFDITDKEQVVPLEFSVNEGKGDYAVDIPVGALERTYYGSDSGNVYVTPKANPEIAVLINTSLTKEKLFMHPLAGPFFHAVPREFWCIEETSLKLDWKPGGFVYNKNIYRVATGKPLKNCVEGEYGEDE